MLSSGSNKEFSMGLSNHLDGCTVFSLDSESVHFHNGNCKYFLKPFFRLVEVISSLISLNAVLLTQFAHALAKACKDGAVGIPENPK